MTAWQRTETPYCQGICKSKSFSINLILLFVRDCRVFLICEALSCFINAGIRSSNLILNSRLITIISSFEKGLNPLINSDIKSHETDRL